MIYTNYGYFCEKYLKIKNVLTRIIIKWNIKQKHVVSAVLTDTENQRSSMSSLVAP